MITLTLTKEEAEAISTLISREWDGGWQGVSLGRRRREVMMLVLHKIRQAEQEVTHD